MVGERGFEPPTPWSRTKSRSKSKCFIWCRLGLGARAPFFLSLSCTEVVPNVHREARASFDATEVPERRRVFAQDKGLGQYLQRGPVGIPAPQHISKTVITDELTPRQVRFRLIFPPVQNEAIRNLDDNQAVRLLLIMEAVFPGTNVLDRIKNQIVPGHAHWMGTPTRSSEKLVQRPRGRDAGTKQA